MNRPEAEIALFCLRGQKVSSSCDDTSVEEVRLKSRDPLVELSIQVIALNKGLLGRKLFSESEGIVCNQARTGKNGHKRVQLTTCESKNMYFVP